MERNGNPDYDIVIVGGGTAGMTAAIYAVRSGKTALMLEGAVYGGQIINTPDIENYPGLAFVSGFEFANSLYNQATGLGVEMKFERAAAVEEADGLKIVRTERNAYSCRAVILATGAKNRPLGLENEQALIGRGVSYCATCDGMFYRDKVVAVNGGGNTAIEDAAFLAGYCEKVYLIHRRRAFRAHEKEVERLKARENVEFILDSAVTALYSDPALQAIEVTNVRTGEKKKLEVAGLFIAIGQMPDNTAFAGLVELDGQGYSAAGEDCRTRTPGIFTAGDCRTKAVRQLTTAASDGAVAALAACEYIDRLE